MILTNHGGKCCGIKTIWGMGYGPKAHEEKLPPLAKIDLTNADIAAQATNQMQRFFHKEAPEETRLERLDRYIQYVQERRPKHVIEIVLAEGNIYTTQMSWVPLLRRRGFKCVTKAKNSNSGNTIHIFHKVIGA